MQKRWTRRTHVLLLVGALAPALAVAQTRRPVEQVLDERVTKAVELDDKIGDVFKDINDKFHVRLKVHPKAVEWLPYGDETRVNVRIENLSLRQGLEQIFCGLGLAMHVEDDYVVVDPSPVLDRLGRRMSIAEAELLRNIAAEPLHDYRIEQFEIDATALGRSASEAKTSLRVALKDIPAGNGLEQLEAATTALGWTWTPDNGRIVLAPQVQDLERRLDRPLDLNYTRVPLDEFLVDVGRRAGVLMRFEPGALERVRARERKIDFIQRNVSLRQVLELITGRTGLPYHLERDAVVIGSAAPALVQPSPTLPTVAPDPNTAAPPVPTNPPPAVPEAVPGTRPRVVAILRVPAGNDGTTLDILLYADMVPAEYQQVINDMLNQKLPQVIDLLKMQVESQR